MASIKCTFPHTPEVWLEGLRAYQEHMLQVHFNYAEGVAISSSTLEDFERVKENVKWLLLNRKGCTGDDRLLNRWYETDFLKLWQYDSATQGFKPIVISLTINEIRKQPSPDSIIRARQDLQMQAEIKIIACAKAGLPANPEDTKLLPKDLTILKRRHRQAIMQILMKAEKDDYNG